MYNENNILKIYFDCEFTGLHKNNQLISIALISENFDVFYAERNDLNYKLLSEPNVIIDDNDVLISDFVRDNVVDNLLFNNLKKCQISLTEEQVKDLNIPLLQTLESYKDSFQNISRKLNAWLEKINKDNKQIQFYCDCGYFDTVLLIDLITNSGSSLDLPDNISYIPVDLCTVLQLNNYDPDMDRNQIILSKELHNQLNISGVIDKIYKISDFIKALFLYILSFTSNPTSFRILHHNSLFDAIIIMEYFIILLNHPRNL